LPLQGAIKAKNEGAAASLHPPLENDFTSGAMKWEFIFKEGKFPKRQALTLRW